MQTPSELLALAKLRSRLHAPAMAVFVTDDWGFAAKLDELGCLAIRANPAEHHDCDWSPLAGLHVILAQWRTPLHVDSALASAILGANPKVFETLRRCCWGDIVYDADGQWTKNTKARARRGELLVRLSLQ
jgi:hypothetical protein